MIRNPLIPVTAALLLALGGVFPRAAEAERLPFARPGPDSAQINGAPGVRAQDIYAVEFIAINGRNIPGARKTIWLEPGEYELTVRIRAAGTRHNLMWRTKEDEDYNRINVELEAGHTYEIRALLDRTDRRSPYSVVLHNVKDRSSSR